MAFSPLHDTGFRTRRTDFNQSNTASPEAEKVAPLGLEAGYASRVLRAAFPGHERVAFPSAWLQAQPVDVPQDPPANVVEPAIPRVQRRAEPRPAVMARFRVESDGAAEAAARIDLVAIMGLPDGLVLETFTLVGPGGERLCFSNDPLTRTAVRVAAGAQSPPVSHPGAAAAPLAAPLPAPPSAPLSKEFTLGRLMAGRLPEGPASQR